VVIAKTDQTFANLKATASHRIDLLSVFRYFFSLLNKVRLCFDQFCGHFLLQDPKRYMSNGRIYQMDNR